MNLKKIFIVVVLTVFVTISGFSQARMGIGVMGTYNPFNPSLWSVGCMFDFMGDYSGKDANDFRIGMTVGQTTVTYEKKNPFNSKKKMTEYWQKSLYMDWIFGYVRWIGLSDNLALRFGSDAYFSFAYAYNYSGHDEIPNNDMPFNIGLTGIGGLAIFPKGKYSILIDLCPGFTLNPLKKGAETFAFILPIRLTVSMN